jgi:DNA-binding NarL/FixJ family response regulator
MKRILLVEDHPAFRQGLILMLNREPDFEVVAQAGSLAETRNLATSSSFDVALVDLSLPDGDGRDLIGELHQANPHASVLVLTINPDLTQHASAREAGAKDVLSKETALDQIADAIRSLEG